MSFSMCYSLPHRNTQTGADSMHTTDWRIERNHKMQFCVVRDTPEGREVLKSASGKDSSFKTSAGARRARDRANREAMEQADSACQLCGEDSGTKCGAVHCPY